MSASSIHRYVRDLARNGYIKLIGGNKFKGFEYQIVDYTEYQKLKDHIDEKLQSILDSIPPSQSYPTSKNGINKELTANTLS